MEAVPFNKNKHYAQICEWAMAYKMAIPPINLLPQCGQVVDGIAAVFLYLTDSDLGFIESLICNPEISDKWRGEAIELCVKGIEKEAMKNGITFLMGSTYIPGVMERAKDLGFKVMPERYKMITKRLL